MRRSFVVLFAFAFLVGAACARAQVVPSANGRQLVVNVGGEASAFQPDYTGQGVAVKSPQHLYGFGAYVDADFTRWIQVEAEGRWLHWNSYAGVTQNTYQIGPRVPVGDFKGFIPYGKFLIGWGSGPFLTGRTTVWTYGGGVDYRLGKKFTLRCFDFEYQNWNVSPTLHPYGGSIGLSYRVF